MNMQTHIQFSKILFINSQTAQAERWFCLASAAKAWNSLQCRCGTACIPPRISRLLWDRVGSLRSKPPLIGGPWSRSDSPPSTRFGIEYRRGTSVSTRSHCGLHGSWGVGRAFCELCGGRLPVWQQFSTIATKRSWITMRSSISIAKVKFDSNWHFQSDFTNMWSINFMFDIFRINSCIDCRFSRCKFWIWSSWFLK